MTLPSNLNRLSASLENGLDSAVETAVRLGGGDFAESFRVTLTGGRPVFLKTHQRPPPLFFSTEAAGLKWLKEGPVAVPEVLLVSDDPPVLVLQWIEIGSGGRGTEEALGRGLAQLHKMPFECFGRPDQRTTGSQAVPNTPSDNWPDFYANCRLLPLAKLAADRAVLSSRTVHGIEQLAAQLGEFGCANETPSLLHGDLWAGNRVVDQEGVSWLIDPAAQGGNREFDLAMMRLFGGYGDACFSAYAESFPLNPGWQERIPLHQLAPLIVHAIKFDGHYVQAVEQVVREFS